MFGETLKVLNLLESEGLFQYVIGGSVAALHYMEPFLTEDCDVFVHFEQHGTIISVSPIYERLAALGYPANGPYVSVEGIEVQFLPITTPLVQEAYDNPASVTMDGQPTKIFSLEYLLAICAQTSRPKDWAKIAMCLEQGISIDFSKLEEILKRYSLWNKWVNKTMS